MCDCDCPESKYTKWQQIRLDTALQLGRDLMDIGLVPFLTMLVGEDSVTLVFERHAGEG